MTLPKFMVIGLQIGELQVGEGKNPPPWAMQDSEKHSLFRDRNVLYPSLTKCLIISSNGPDGQLSRMNQPYVLIL